jgi:hypothetical protein
VISFPYGVIEHEPSFPLTIFGGDRAVSGGRTGGKRGIMGNAQTHCIQLPNTFAFARSAQGLSVEKADYIKFANDLIPGQGALIVEAWDALQGSDIGRMRAATKGLSRLKAAQLTAGPLKGLLFGDPARFVNDLVLQLQLAASVNEFSVAVNKQPKKQELVKSTLAAMASSADAWQQKHGYSNRWNWPLMEDALRKLDSPEINAILDGRIKSATPGHDPFEDVKKFFMNMESFTPRLIAAMRTAATGMDKK